MKFDDDIGNLSEDEKIKKKTKLNESYSKNESVTPSVSKSF